MQKKLPLHAKPPPEKPGGGWSLLAIFYSIEVVPVVAVVMIIAVTIIEVVAIIVVIVEVALIAVIVVAVAALCIEHSRKIL